MAPVHATWFVFNVYDCELQVLCAGHFSYYDVRSHHTGFLCRTYRLLCMSYRRR